MINVFLVTPNFMVKKLPVGGTYFNHLEIIDELLLQDLQIVLVRQRMFYT